MARLRRVDCSDPGIMRRRRGRGFEYLWASGVKIADPELLAWIKSLTIPPAWTEVWIRPHPNGHIQAVGTDTAGRKQYLYHPRWRERRNLEKFDRMLEFARRLPRLRKTCRRALAADGMGRDKVLACAVTLLDHGFLRIGTESYAEENGTYGLATMKRSHVRFRSDIIVFDYPAKGGKRLVQSFVDPAVREVVLALKKRRGGGAQLFAHKDGRRWSKVKSTDINDYLKHIAGDEFTAKDFRTWNATVLAAVAVAVSGEAARSKTARRRAEARAVKEVAHYLGNTPAVCRASYIDPRLLDRYRSGWTIAGALEAIGKDAAFGEPSIHGAIEDAVLDLLEDDRSSTALMRVA